MDPVDGAFSPVEGLWFSDGTVVIRAENSIFRVYAALLAARSTVFQDMMGFPQPADVETLEGCPVVQLQDSAVDVTSFFKAIFDSSFFEPYPARTDLSIVVSVLRLSNKYDVDYLRRRALIHLSSSFPTVLSDYDNKWERMSMSDLFFERPGASVLAIQIAREVHALWILPSAFYFMAETDESLIQSTLSIAAYKGHAACLSAHDQMLFMKSNLQLSRETHHLLRFLYSPDVIPGCTGGEVCRRARMHALAAIQEEAYEHNTDLDPMDVFDPNKLEACKICCEFSTQANQEGRQSIWEKLPKMCGLPSWKELEKMKEAALAG
ncbi:hypothetical protein FB45DRAFT_843484 [Roridomyces roridus]|uniref:BTB domain-containing protein n=1 Tax=Roridomyces roridus TaxID=1738132 RepID=A0AAD7B6K2_9AGAR|nr:hypothetical protein FB45DRAFT_843484 [Roridomyces roridus]